jgi:hypothetical protein
MRASIEEHLQQLCKKSSVTLEPCPSFDSLLGAVLSSKWRRSAMDQYSHADTSQKVFSAVESSVAIEFSIPFGGYKAWHEPSAPHLNWAEVFLIAYLAEHGRRIASFHAPGVIFSLSFSGGVMDLLSNFKPDWQDIYVSEFQQILEYFSTSDVQFRMVDISEFVGGRMVLREKLKARAEKYLEYWPLEEKEKTKKIASAARNLCPNGITDLRNLSPLETSQVVVRSAIMCDALDSLEERRQFNKYSHRVQLVFVRGPTPALHIGSCRTSSFHPWAGTGFLEIRPEAHLERICSVQSPAGHPTYEHRILWKNPWDLPGLHTVFVIPEPTSNKELPTHHPELRNRATKDSLPPQSV